MAEPTEIEKLVGDLEIAIDRLRSLYEQYFMGIEKLEPTVPRKDVDRRIHHLRKEQIRNTAQRFRFQMILQRYNTYQTHWMRICREIENGTYKRHIIRAQRRFGDGKARRSVVPPPVEESARPGPPPGPKPLAAPGALGSLELEAELAELDREFAPPEQLDDIDVELEEESRRPIPVARPIASPRPLPLPAQASPLWRKASPDAPVPTLRPPLPSSNATRAAPAARPSGPPPLPPSATMRVAPSVGPPVPPRPSSGASRAAPVATPPPKAQPTSTALRAALVAPPATPPARPPGELPEDRVRALYSQYVDAKRRQNESTATITYDAVAKSLRDSSAKLRDKYGKAVDFEVTVKDGRAILKPVLK